MDSRITNHRENQTKKQPRKTEPNISADRVNPSTVQRREFILKARSFTLDLGPKTRIMGIVNVTPDSFSHDGQYSTGFNHKKAVRYARQLVRQGADILDIGGESTRPGAKRVAIKEELNRVIPVIEALAGKINIPISIDTYKPAVARAALKAGASLVNTIKGCSPDTQLLKTVQDYDAAIILMHMQGVPQTMQKNIVYSDLMGEIFQSLKKSAEKCLENGIKSDKIVIDPGIGFGKTVRHNLMIINRLNVLKALNYPLLIGTSRKSFIGKILNKEVHRRLTGTIASISASVINGAHIVRVHDVAAVKEAVTLTDAIIHETEY